MGGIDDEACVGLLKIIEWRWNANNDCVHVCQIREVRGCHHPVGPGFLNFLRRNPVDVGLPFLQGIYFAVVDIEAGYREVCPGVQKCKRKPNIAEADNSYLCLVGKEPRFKLLSKRSRRRTDHKA